MERTKTAALAALGLPPDADRDDITRAYRRLARAVHPDVSSEPDAAASFDAITNAYRIAVAPAPGEQQKPPATVTQQPRRRAARRDTFIVAGPVCFQPWRG